MVLLMGKTTAVMVEHEVVVEWFNSSMVGATVSGLSESEIVSQIDSMGAGLGAYSAEIGVIC